MREAERYSIPDFNPRNENPISETDYKILQTRISEAITFLKKPEFRQALAEYELLKQNQGNKPVKLTSTLAKKSFQIVSLLKRFGAEKINDQLAEISVIKDSEFTAFIATKTADIESLIPPKIVLDPILIKEVGLGASLDRFSRLNVLISRFLEIKKIDNPQSIKKKNIKPFNSK